MGENPFFTREECVRGGRACGAAIRDRYGKDYFRVLGRRSADKRRVRFSPIPLVILPNETRNEAARRYGIHRRTLYTLLRNQVRHE